RFSAITEKEILQRGMERAMNTMRCLVAGLIALTLPACTSNAPKTYKVTGTVTWNNQAMPEGDIIFTPVEGNLTPDPGKISNGTFTVMVKAGKKKVQIFASRESDKVDPAMGAKRREMYVPERYNAKTTLERDVTPDGENNFTFDLKP